MEFLISAEWRISDNNIKLLSGLVLDLLFHSFRGKGTSLHMSRSNSRRLQSELVQCVGGVTGMFGLERKGSKEEHFL